MKKIILTSVMFIIAALAIVNAQVINRINESVTPYADKTWGKPTGTYDKSRAMTLFIVKEKPAVESETGKTLFSYTLAIDYAGDAMDTGLYYVLPNTLEVEQGQTIMLRLQATPTMKWTQLRMFADWNINYSLDDDGELFKVVGEKLQGNDDIRRVEFEYTIPEDAKVGETRIRIQYNDAWFMKDDPNYKNTSMDEIMTGRVYDVNVKVNAKKLEKVSTPTFSPVPNKDAVEGPLKVTLSCETEDAIIKYTLDGSEPSKDNGMVYDSNIGIELMETKTVKAIAIKDGMSNSEVVTATYTIMKQVAAPTFTPSADNEYTETVSIEIMTETEGAKIVYTLDGTDPKDTPDAMVFEKGKPIVLENTTTVKAIAVKDGMKASAIVEKTYTINIKSSVEDISRSGLKVYPTIVKDSFTVEYLKPSIATLYSISGQIIKRFNVNGVTKVSLDSNVDGLMILMVDGHAVKLRK